MMILQTISLTVVSLLVATCSLSNHEHAHYRAEAKAFCQVHKPEYWVQSGRLDELNAMSPTEKAETLIKEIHLTITSKEMAIIIFDEGGKLPASEFYPFLQEEIPKLTKDPFDCPAIPDFYIAQ